MAKKKSTENPLTYKDYTYLSHYYFRGAKECFLMATAETNAVKRIDLRMQGLRLQQQALFLLEEANRLLREMVYASSR